MRKGKMVNYEKRCVFRCFCKFYGHYRARREFNAEHCSLFQSVFKISPWRNFIYYWQFFKQLWLHWICRNIETKKFGNAIPNCSQEVANRVWQKHDQLGRIYEGAAPLFLFLVFSKKKLTNYLSGIFHWFFWRGWGGKEKDNLRSTATSLASSFWIFWSSPDICLTIVWTKLRRTYRPADSNTHWRLT